MPRTTLETTRCLKLIVSMSRCPRLHSTCAKSFESWKMKWWMSNVAILVIHAEFWQQIQVFARNLEDARVSKRNIRLAELSRTGRLRKEMMEREAIADRDPQLIDFKRWLKEYEHRPWAAVLGKLQ